MFAVFGDIGPSFWMAIAQLLISDQFVVIWAGAVLAYATICGLEFYYRHYLVTSQLKHAIKLIDAESKVKDGKSLIPALTKGLDQNKIVRLSWQKLTSYISKESGAEDPTLLKSVPEFISYDCVVGTKINEEYYRSLPGQFTALGILGTFSGLSSGIYLAQTGLKSTDMNLLQASLSQLLQGASLAFWTSIVGVTASLIFTRLEKSVSFRTESIFSNLINLLEQTFPVSQKDQNSKILESEMEQTLILKAISQTLLDLVPKTPDNTKKLLRELVTDFRQSMGESVQKEVSLMTETFHHINQSLKTSVDALDSVSRIFHTTSDQSSKEFKRNLHEFTHQFHSSVYDTSEMIKKSFHQAAGHICHSLENSGKNLQDSLKKPIDGLNQNLAKVSESSQKVAEIWRTTNQKAIEHHSLVMTSQEHILDHVAPLLATTQAIIAASKHSQDSVKEATKTFGQVFEASLCMREATEVLKTQWDNYSQRFAGLDLELSRVFQQNNQCLNHYADRMRAFTLELDQQLSKGLRVVATAVGDLNHTVKSLPVSLEATRPTSHTDRHL